MKRFKITYREWYECNACANGYAMTSFGPKPCPSCGASGAIYQDEVYDVNENELCNFNNEQVVSVYEYEEY
jgi:DnaJ-class molecular chaperone